MLFIIKKLWILFNKRLKPYYIKTLLQKYAVQSLCYQTISVSRTSKKLMLLKLYTCRKIAKQDILRFKDCLCLFSYAYSMLLFTWDMKMRIWSGWCIELSSCCSGTYSWRLEPTAQLSRVYLGNDDSCSRWHGRASLQLRRHLPTTQNWQREFCQPSSSSLHLVVWPAYTGSSHEGVKPCNFVPHSFGIF